MGPVPGLGCDRLAQAIDNASKKRTRRLISSARASREYRCHYALPANVAIRAASGFKRRGVPDDWRRRRIDIR